MVPALLHVLISVFMETSRRQIVACVTVRFSGSSSLFKKHKDDASADWLYSRALVAFRESGESEEAAALAFQALDANAHMPGVLSGATKAKPRKDGYVTMGGADEAAVYAEHWGKAWRSAEGAVAWLLRLAAQREGAGETRH
jgi:hypothetical protein